MITGRCKSVDCFSFKVTSLVEYGMLQREEKFRNRIKFSDVDYVSISM